MSIIEQIINENDYQILASIEVNMAIEKAESSKGEKKVAAIKYLEYLWEEIVEYEYESTEKQEFMMNLGGYLYEKLQQF